MMSSIQISNFILQSRGRLLSRIKRKLNYKTSLYTRIFCIINQRFIQVKSTLLH